MKFCSRSIAFAACLLLTDCQRAGSPSAQAAVGSGEMPEIKLVPATALKEAEASYGITDASIEADVLRLRVSYDGGCREHAFELLGPSDFAESAPQQVRIRLAHDNNGDSCKKLVREELLFDLSPLRERYQETRRATSGTLQLLLLNRRLEYRF
jgi:hypothetical protein